jgi:hypothetical protein
LLHEYTDGNWAGTVNSNTSRLHSTLLKLSAMGDVNVIDLADGDALKWDAGSQKYVNFIPLVPPTTTTTTTTSTTTSTTFTGTTTTTSTITTTTVALTAVTWDPDNKAPNITLSLGDLVIDGGVNSYEQVLATEGKSTGKWYFEVYLTAIGSIYGQIGVQADGGSLTTNIGSAADGWGYMGNTRFYNNGSFINPTGGSTGTWTNGHTVMVAVDFDAGNIWWGWDGVWGTVGTIGDPASGAFPHYSNITGTLFPAACCNSTSSNYTGRFTSTDQVYPVPSGFTAWGD